MRPTYLKNALAVPLALALLVVSCQRSEVQEEKKPGPRMAQVRTITLEPQSWMESIRTHGTVEAAEEVNLALDFSATARFVHFEEGDRVEVGQVLVEVDKNERKMQLTQVARAVEDAKARLDRARGAMNRRETLFVNNSISREVYQSARADMLSAKAQYEEALAAQSLAQQDLEETILMSPVNGAVASRSIDPGETVMPGQVLCVIQVVDAVRVVTFVSEKDINSLRVGGRARVQSAGVRGREYPARIESLGVKAEPRTGNFTVKLAVQNDDGLLRDGMTASVELQGIEYPNALLIPESAIVDRNRRRVVYKVTDGKAHEVQPVLGASTGDKMPVLGGLAFGDVLIVEGLQSVVEDSAVEILPGATQ